MKRNLSVSFVALGLPTIVFGMCGIFFNLFGGFSFVFLMSYIMPFRLVLWLCAILQLAMVGWFYQRMFPKMTSLAHGNTLEVYLLIFLTAIGYILGSLIPWGVLFCVIVL